MRNPNTQCHICHKPFYRRPHEFREGRLFCCRGCRSELYKKYPKKVKNLDKGRGWNKGMSKARGDELKYGKPRSPETKERISKKLKGRTFTEEHKKAISRGRRKLFDRIGRVGKCERGWKSARWRKDIYKRDNYACQKCGEIDCLTAHHILSWKDYPELRYELDNGITLCAKCHKKLHRGKTRNNPL